MNCVFSPLSSNFLCRHSQQTKAMLFTRGCAKGALEESIAWAACWLMLLSLSLLYMCSFHLHLFFLVLFLGSLCPNMCLASLFSLAIHCLTAEVFFQPFKSCTLKFPAKDNQVCILLSLPVLSLCTLSCSPGRLAASPLGLSYHESWVKRTQIHHM